MKHLNNTLQSCKPFLESLEPLSINRDPNMTHNLYVCMICFRPEVVYGVISGANVKTMEGYLVVNFEVASSNSFRDILIKIISWRRRRRRRTSMIALSVNAFAFRFVIGIELSMVLLTARRLRSCDQGLFVVPPTRTMIPNIKALFSSQAAPTVWNSLPSHRPWSFGRFRDVL